MKRNIEKLVKEYNKLSANENPAATFYNTDIQQVLDLSGGTCDAVINGLWAGFMVGYECAKKQAGANNH